MKKIILLILLLTLNNIAFANTDIKQEILNKNIRVGDYIKYKITIPLDNGTITFKTKDFSPFDLINKSQKITPDKKSVEYLFTLSIYETGEQIIPELKFIKIKDKNESEIIIPKKKITVNSVLKADNNKNQGIKDIKPTVSITEKTYLFIYIMIGVLLIIIIYYILKKQKNKKKKEIITIEKKLPAHEIAYKKLSELINQELIKKGKIKEYVFILSEIIREFIGNRYDFDSIELTSDELLSYIRREPKFNREHIPVINNFLEDSDIIKFSKIEATNEELEQLTKLAFKIVDDLKINIMD